VSAVLYVLPALLLLAALLCGRYPGERLLVAAAAAVRRWARRAGGSLPRPRLIDPVSLPRGGALLAVALAGRAPPRVGRATSAWLHRRRRFEKGA
jgi:hypothetical protein